jgi:hypothetical protein
MLSCDWRTPGRHRVRGKVPSPPGISLCASFDALNSFLPEQADTGRNGYLETDNQERSSV